MIRSDPNINTRDCLSLEVPIEKLPSEPLLWFFRQERGISEKYHTRLPKSRQ